MEFLMQLSATWVCKPRVAADPWGRLVGVSRKQDSGFHCKEVQMGY